ncbi:MAG: ABC transporter substrate-binding protein, partial [Rhodospirillales bacterium]
MALALTASMALPAHAADKMTVLLDWFVNPDHATLVIAKEKGFFAAQGLDVDLVAPANPEDPPKLVAAGKAEIAISYQPQLHVQVDQGLPLARVATLVATPLTTLLVLKDGPVKTIADLKGKKVGFSVGGFEVAVLGAMLEGAGLSLKDVELVNVNFSLSPSLISGQVAAVIGAYRNFELNQMAIVGQPGLAFYPEENGVPPYDELIAVTNTALANDPRLPRFVAALEAAVQYVINHPDDAYAAFIGAYPDLNDELNKRAWTDTLARFALRPSAVDRARYRTFADFLQSRGLIKAQAPLASYLIAP